MDQSRRCAAVDQHGHRCNQHTGHEAMPEPVLFHSAFGHNWESTWKRPVAASKRAKKKSKVPA